jgi:peptidoglycan hydrolase-like protein with peptidoglycan-binding domain
VLQHVSAQDVEIDMRAWMLLAVSITALGMAGANVINAADNKGGAQVPGANVPASSASAQGAVNPSKDDILQAQQQLRAQHLYNGPIDGMLNPQTKHALSAYQKKNGLGRTATLDQATRRSLFEHTGVSGGSNLPSSLPPSPTRPTGSMANPPLASPPAGNLGGPTAPDR